MIDNSAIRGDLTAGLLWLEMSRDGLYLECIYNQSQSMKLIPLALVAHSLDNSIRGKTCELVGSMFWTRNERWRQPKAVESWTTLEIQLSLRNV